MRNPFLINTFAAKPLGMNTLQIPHFLSCSFERL
jgi:hypothetical protein